MQRKEADAVADAKAAEVGEGGGEDEGKGGGGGGTRNAQKAAGREREHLLGGCDERKGSIEGAREEASKGRATHTCSANAPVILSMTW